MNPIQVAEAQVITAKKAHLDFIASQKNPDGTIKPRTDESAAKLTEHEESIKSAEANFEWAKKMHAADSQNAQKVETTKVFSTDDESVQAAKSDTQVKAFALPRHSRVKSFKDIPGGYSKEEQAYRFGRWAHAAIARDMKSLSWCKENGLEIKAQSESVNTAGGFLVPDEFSTTLIDLREQYGVLRQYARIEPMGSDTKFIPRRASGATTYWIAEGATITESTATFDQVQLIAKKLAALLVMSSEVMEDAFIDLGDYLAREIAYAFAKAEDAAGFMGDGTSTYGGITGITLKIRNLSSTRADIAGLHVGTGNNPSEITLTDLTTVASLLPEYVGAMETRWYMHKSYYWTVCIDLALAAGGVAAQEVNNTAYTSNPMFLSYPVVFVQSMTPAFGDAAATDLVTILFGDLRSAVALGDRRQTTLMMSEHHKFATDQLALRGTERLDINVHDVGNATSTAADKQPGPLVGLLMKAS